MIQKPLARRACTTAAVFLFLAPHALASETGELSAALQPFVDRHELTGAVALVATADRILSLQAIGFSDVAGKQTMRVDSLFWIASMSKAMTAAATMILVDEGKVELDEPVQKYLPAFSPRILDGDLAHATLRAP